MRKLYEEPLFEIDKFSFEDILDDYVKDSDPESDPGSEGGEISSDPWGDE